MADIVDIANERAELEREVAISNFGRYELPEGEEGICEICDEHSPRLINHTCARCRDKYGLD